MMVPPNAWFIREKAIKMDDDWGYPYDSGNPHIFFGKPPVLDGQKSHPIHPLSCPLCVMLGP